jgi:hypothetical protein
MAAKTEARINAQPPGLIYRLDGGLFCAVCKIAEPEQEIDEDLEPYYLRRLGWIMAHSQLHEVDPDSIPHIHKVTP